MTDETLVICDHATIECNAWNYGEGCPHQEPHEKSEDDYLNCARDHCGHIDTVVQCILVTV